MTRSEVERLLEEYRAGLESELALLRQLSMLARRQRTSTESRNFERLSAESDERDHVTRELVTLEDGLAELRHRLAAIRGQAASLPGYQIIVDLRRTAAEMVSSVLSVDQESMKSLSDAELARRAAMAGLERGETTLAAYRKVLSPPVEHAAIVDRVG
jgi:hypothetical protein